MSQLRWKEAAGCRFSGPKWEFVLLEHWDEKLDGKLEEDKVVEQVIKGQKALGRVFWWTCLYFVCPYLERFTYVSF